MSAVVIVRWLTDNIRRELIDFTNMSSGPLPLLVKAKNRAIL